jgi:hypothetical protein
MRVSYILYAVVGIIIIFGLRVLVGRYFTLEGRALGAEMAMVKASSRYDDAAEALAALLGVQLQSGDAVFPTLLAAYNGWDSTVGAGLPPGDPVSRTMTRAVEKLRDAEQTLTKPGTDSRP